MTDADQLLATWRKTYSELFPHRPMEAMQYEDSALALGVTLQREMQRFFEDQRAKAAKTPLVRARTLDRLSKHDPRDAE